MKKKIDEELGKTMSELKADANKQLKGLEYHRNIPEVGWDKEKIVAEIEKLMGLGDYKVTDRRHLLHNSFKSLQGSEWDLPQARQGQGGGDDHCVRADCLHQPSQPRCLPWHQEDGGRGGENGWEPVPR